MQAINQKERSNLFWQFVICSIATLALCLTVLYFDFSLPDTLTDSQKQKYQEYQKFSGSQKKIMETVETIRSQIDDMPNSSDVTGEDADVSAAIERFKDTYWPKDITDTASTTAKLIDALYNTLKKYKIAQKSLAEEIQKNTNLNSEKEKLEKAKNVLQKQYDEISGKTNY